MTPLRHLSPSSEAIPPETHPTAPSPPPARRGRRRQMVAGILIVLLAGAGLALWQFQLARTKTPDNVIFVSGRIEGDDAAVASKAAGRILEIRVREGDPVHAGDVIAILDDEQIRAREQQARAGLGEAEAKSKAARDQIAVLEQQFQQGQDEVKQQDAAYQLALFDKEAYTRLAESGAVSE